MKLLRPDNTATTSFHASWACPAALIFPYAGFFLSLMPHIQIIKLSTHYEAICSSYAFPALPDFIC